MPKNVPPDKAGDLDYLVEQLDWEANVDPQFKKHHFIEPIADGDTSGEGYVDRWVVYGKINGQQFFTAKELTIQPQTKVTIRDNGASGLILLQGRGRIENMPLECPAMIRYGELTEDEVFITAARARKGYTIENQGTQSPMVCLRYFGPDVNPQAPEVGDAPNA